ncbi:MAG: hypothetical protein WD176_07130 [Pirellulales bacterium]
MSRKLILTLAAVFAATVTTTAWSQVAQSGPGADTFNSAGANTFSTAGTAGQLGAPVPQPAQIYPSGLPVLGQPTVGSAATARFNQTFGTTTFGAYPTNVFISPTPWFSTPAVRQQLQLNAIQYHHLYSAYVDAYTRYNQAAAELPANLALAERAGQLQALQEVFSTDFNNTLDATVTNPEVRQNFNTLGMQYQNRSLASVPSAQAALSLTPEQHRRLSLMAYQWNQLAAQLRERAAADKPVASDEVSDLNSEAQKQIESTLSPEQRSVWPQLVGQYYDLDAPAAAPQSSTPPAPNTGSTE